MVNMAEKFRFGIVGCGLIGPVHAETIACLSDAQLVSVVDLNPEKAQKLASQYGATPYTHLQQMLDHERVDVVIYDPGAIIAGELPWLLSVCVFLHVLFLLISEKLTATICQRA
jgi:pyrroline-5-carboxylate reductase